MRAASCINAAPTARRRLVEAAAHRKVAADTLRELFGLHSQARRARGVQRELALFDHAQVDRADAVPDSRELQRTLVVANAGFEYGVAIAQRGLGGEGILDLAERMLLLA